MLLIVRVEISSLGSQHIPCVSPLPRIVPKSAFIAQPHHFQLVCEGLTQRNMEPGLWRGFRLVLSLFTPRGVGGVGDR